jgi:hypothetical protein
MLALPKRTDLPLFVIAAKERAELHFAYSGTTLKVAKNAMV